MRYLPTSPGPAQTLDGRVVGTHQGLMYYTIGQRHGLGIGGPGEPWYVVGKDLERNRLLVAQGREHPALFKDQLGGRVGMWISGAAPRARRAYTAKTRYRQPDAPCNLMRADGDACELNFGESAVGDHAGTIRGALRRRRVSGRQHHLLTASPVHGNRRCLPIDSLRLGAATRPTDPLGCVASNRRPLEQLPRMPLQARIAGGRQSRSAKRKLNRTRATPHRGGCRRRSRSLCASRRARCALCARTDSNGSRSASCPQWSCLAF